MKDVGDGRAGCEPVPPCPLILPRLPDPARPQVSREVCLLSADSGAEAQLCFSLCAAPGTVGGSAGSPAPHLGTLEGPPVNGTQPRGPQGRAQLQPCRLASLPPGGLLGLTGGLRLSTVELLSQFQANPTKPAQPPAGGEGGQHASVWVTLLHSLPASVGLGIADGVSSCLILLKAAPRSPT